MTQGAWICLLAPLAGAWTITVMGDTISRRTAAWISTLSVFVAFGGALATFVGLLRRSEEERAALTTAWTWLSTGNFEVGLTLLVDPLAATMMLIVSGVGGLIVLYSVGYMDGDDEERRYFAYMSFFVFSMLMLVQAGNFLLLLVGWGLVGLASYLLIGFWHERAEAVAAAKKAFIMNAAGDATMALAFFVLIWQTGTLEFAEAFVGAEGMSSTLLNLVALGLLGGAVAKSAQIPLHTWLPDAMEGPTPVSALIHAATMVTAGVYLIVRAHPLFELAPSIQDLAAGLGALTLLVAGFIALVQTDIKRVIAYSTMSQIGYMFLGVGLGAYGNGMFHLMTHAFFKALLFLAAGVVIHHLHDEQDIRRMGGLKSALPRTHVAFLIGTVALVGLPPFAGFWSKDAIIASALERGDALGWTLFVASLVGVLLTGAYSFRLYFAVFQGKPHEAEALHARARESHGEGPRSMLLPVGILAILSAIGGLLSIPGVWHPFTHCVEETGEPLVEATARQDYLVSAISVALGIVGLLFARRAFLRDRQLVTAPTAWRLFEHKFYFDELYDALFYRPSTALSNALRRRVEEPVIERSLDEIGSGTILASDGLARVQSGLLRTYALAIAFSVCVLVVVFVAVR